MCHLCRALYLASQIFQFCFMLFYFVFKKTSYRPFISAIFSQLILLSIVTVCQSLSYLSSSAHGMAPEPMPLLIIGLAVFSSSASSRVKVKEWGGWAAGSGGWRGLVLSSYFSHFSYFGLKSVVFSKQCQLIKVTLLTCREPIYDCLEYSHKVLYSLWSLLFVSVC